MAKIKHTKNELKAQMDALRRYERFLPMLQLKKQQLQMEIGSITAKCEQKESEEKSARKELSVWIRLFAEPAGIENLVKIDQVDMEEGNIAGVNIPVFKDVIMQKAPYDLFETPTWFDDAIDITNRLIRIRIEREALEEQKRLIAEELRVTSQRVNLFEQIKIPECRENIRIIKIFLGDEQTAAVVRGKIAKRRTQSS